MNYIYSYTNKVNGHQYIGQTDNIERRKREHKSNAFNPNSNEYNYLFHKKLREYGENNFIFSILQEVEKEDANEAEIFWIKKLKTYAGDGLGGYNLTRGGFNHEHQSIYYDKIEEIKNEIKNRRPFIEISNKYSISISHISAINHGTYYYDENENYPLCKYYKDEDEKDYIKNLIINSTKPLTQLAKELNISYSTIKKINSGDLWKDNKNCYPLRNKNANQQRADIIKEMLLKNKSNKEIMVATGASVETIKRINSGITHKDNSLNYPLRSSL